MIRTKLTEKQAAYAKYMFTPGSSTFGNGTASARKAGYKGNDYTLNTTSRDNLRKPLIVAEKERIQADIREDIEFNYDKSIKELNQLAFYAEALAKRGNIQAINAVAGLIRIKNEITGLNKVDPGKSGELIIKVQGRPEYPKLAKGG